ncbi:MAG: Cna B-type domain-containing protein [Lachnospiraceae bacterium]|nr:Cna B-type domain-containing protein [Lachnospiraceae bacterium]
MQNKLQQRITGLLNAHRVKRKWKILTIVLSVIVLCNTFYALQNAAVALNDKNEEQQFEQTIDHVQNGAGNDIDITGVLESSRTETSSGTGTETAGDGTGAATTMPEGTESAPLQGTGSGTESTGTDEAGTGSTTPLVTEGLGGGVEQGDGTILDQSGDTVPDPGTLPEGYLPADPATDPWYEEGVVSSAPLMLSLARVPARAYTLPVNNRIASAEPFDLRITDMSGLPVSRATTSEALIVTVGWKVTDSTQIKAAGDYLDVVLPSQINFGADQFRDGSYRLLEDTRIFGGEVLPAGTSLADYEVSYSDTYGAYVLRIVFTAAGVRANAAGMLTTPALQDAIQWSAIRFEGVYFEQTGTFTPAITAYGSGKTVYNSRQITVIEKKLGQIKDVRIDSFAVNGVVNGTGVSVGAEDPLTLDIAWSWKDLSAFLSSGDYFEIALPESLVITPFDTLGTDTLGNVIRKQVYQNAQGAYILRITYESIGTGYNEFSGNISLLGYIRTKPVFTNGTANMTLTVSVVGGTSYRRAQITVKEQGSMLPDGVWRVRHEVKDVRFSDGTRQDLVHFYDYHVGIDRYNIETNQKVELFVIASHGGALTPDDPLTDLPYDKQRGKGEVTRQDQIVQFIPGVSNFIDAYCANPFLNMHGAGSNGSDITLTRYALENYSGFNNSQKTILRNIMSTAYPYVSLETMAANLRSQTGYSTISREEAVVAVQLAIWWTYDESETLRKITYYPDYSAKTRVETIARALRRYNAGTGSGSAATNYSINNVNVTYNTDGSATVTGRVSPTPPSGLTGILSNHISTQSFTVGSDGRFSVTMADVSRADDLKIVISGYVTGAGAVKVWIFDPGHNQQPMIAAECGSYPIRIEWEKPGSGEVSRNIRIVKRWVDAEGNTMTTLPNQPVTVSLYRRVVVNGTEYAEKVETVTLRRGGQFGDYTWTISQLPVKDANGNVYDYYITEDSAPAGYTFVGIETDVADGGQTIIYTAVNREETTRVKVEKEWEGVADPAGYAVRVQLFVIVNGREVPVYLDKNPTDRNSYTIENGIRTLHGPYYFENAADRYPVIVYLNSKPDEGLSYIFDGLPVRLDGRRLQYVVREISAGPAGHADRWTVTRDQSTGTDWAGSFKVSYTPASAAPDMDAPLPTVTIKNAIEDTGITVVKEWTTLPENVKALSATVVLCKLVKQDGKDALVAVPLYVNVADTILDTSGDVIVGSAYATEKLPGYTKAEWVLAGANTQGIHNNSWRVTYRGLPKYEADGVTIARYTFVETGYSVLENGTVRAYQVEEGATGPVTIAYQQADMDAEQPSVTITNTYDRTRVIVTKAWEGLTEAQKENYRVVAGLFKYDPSGRGGQGAKWPVYVRTDSIRTEVNAQGLVYTGTYSIEDLSQRPHPEYSEVTVELSADNNWTALFEDLPKYEADGKTPVQYIVRELAVYDKDGNDVTQSFNLRYAQYTKVMGDRQTYAWATEAQEGDGTARVDITNTITNGTITVEKKWLNFDGTGWFWATPAWIEVKLTAKRNGAEIADNSDFWKGITQLVRLDETNGWSYTWENILEEKGVTYYIEEIAVVYNRNGREIRIDAKDYTGFIGPDGPVEVVKKNGGGFEITGLENRRETTELIIIKEDKTDHSRLSGAEFTLYRIEEGVEVFVGTFKTGTDTSLPQGYQEGVVLVDGKNHEGLLFGYHYKLVETKAPEGYVDPLNNAPYIIFTMNGSGTPYDPSDDWIEVLGSNENNDAVWETANDKTLGIRWLRVENTPSGYILPEAGGFGTHPYTTGGMSVMMATLLMYGTYRFMYKKEKGGRKNQRHT